MLNKIIACILFMCAAICILYGAIHSFAVIYCFERGHENGLCGMGMGHFDLSLLVYGISFLAPGILLYYPKGLMAIVGYIVLVLLLFSFWVISEYGAAY